MAPKVTIQEVVLDVKSAHGKGQTDVAYAAQGNQLLLLTCGGDGLVHLRDRTTLMPKHTFKADEGSVNVLAVDYAAPNVAVGNDQYVKVAI